MRARVWASAEAAATLTGRMAGIGNATALDRAQQEAYLAEAVADVVRVQNAAAAARAAGAADGRVGEQALRAAGAVAEPAGRARRAAGRRAYRRAV